MNGWAIPGPKDADILGSKLGKQLAAVKDNPNAPALRRAPDGRPQFSGTGFSGLDDVAGSPRAGNVELLTFVSRGPVGKTDRGGKAPSSVVVWWLELLDLRSSDDDPLEPEDLPEGDVVAVGLWPTENPTLRVGQTQTMQMVGVFDTNVFDAVNIGSRAIWEVSPGLVQVGLGKYRAAAPGKQTVRATFTRPDGVKMTATATFQVQADAPD